MGDANATESTGVGWPARRRGGRAPKYTIVQISDPHVPADGFLFDRVDACARVEASVEMIAAAGCSPDVLARNGFRGHAGGGFTRVDILDDGETVATFVPLTGQDEILYELGADEAEVRPLAQTGD